MERKSFNQKCGKNNCKKTWKSQIEFVYWTQYKNNKLKTKKNKNHENYRQYINGKLRNRSKIR